VLRWWRENAMGQGKTGSGDGARQAIGAPALRGCLSALLLMSLAGCGLVDAGTPYVEAHRAAAGYWPRSSRTAIERSIGAGYPAIEVDVALTRDRVAILVPGHGPWLDEQVCAT